MSLKDQINQVLGRLPLTTQQDWIHELHRVIKPGGFAMLSVLGRYHQKKMHSEEDNQELQRTGRLTLDSKHQQVSLSTQL